VARRRTAPVALLRTVAWAVVALAVWTAGKMPGPGGATVGFVLAGTLGAYLYISRNG
jgi:hypothetical protein